MKMKSEKHNMTDRDLPVGDFLSVLIDELFHVTTKLLRAEASYITAYVLAEDSVAEKQIDYMQERLQEMRVLINKAESKLGEKRKEFK